MNALAVVDDNDEKLKVSITPMTSSELLLRNSSSSSVYTTARTCVGGSRILEWEAHVERTARSIGILLLEMATTNSSLLMSLSNPSNLRCRLDVPTKAAIKRYQQENNREDDNNGMEKEEEELQVTILINLCKGAADDVATIYCHGTKLPPIPTPPINVEIRGTPRQHALAKDSSWVRQRTRLESLMKQAQNVQLSELILKDNEDKLYEGSKSNFYVIDQDGTVITAEEGVLHGTIRKLILEVCREHQIPVRLEPPSLYDVATWQGAMISSTSILALPIHALYMPPQALDSEPDQASRHPQDLLKTFDYDNHQSDNPVCLTKQIQQWVSEKLIECSTSIL